MMAVDFREEVRRRLRCAEGHTRGVARMVEAGEPALAVVRQVYAVQASLNRVAMLLLREGLAACLEELMRMEAGEEQGRAIGERLAEWSVILHGRQPQGAPSRSPATLEEQSPSPLKA